MTDGGRPRSTRPGSLVVGTLFKYHAACYLTHAAIECGLKIAAEPGFDAGKVKGALRIHPAEGGETVGCDASEVVRERLRFWAAVAGDQGRRCEAIGVDASAPVPVPRAELAAALDAMLGNVFRYTPQGAPLEVTVSRRDGYVAITVEDGGPGIADPDRALRRGETNLLVPEFVDYFGNSSGSSTQGRPKSLPISGRQIKHQIGSGADALLRYLAHHGDDDVPPTLVGHVVEAHPAGDGDAVSVGVEGALGVVVEVGAPVEALALVLDPRRDRRLVAVERDPDAASAELRRGQARDRGPLGRPAGDDAEEQKPSLPPPASPRRRR